MMGTLRSWPTSDVVAYDTMRDSANRVLAYLLATPASTATYEAVCARLHEIDGYNRTAVDSFAAELSTLESGLAIAYNQTHCADD